jgi:hypothetical protein
MTKRSICETLLDVQREKEREPQYVVVVGPPFEQQSIYGPFPSFDDADEWTSREAKGEYTWIVTLLRPDELS